MGIIKSGKFRFYKLFFVTFFGFLFILQGPYTNTFSIAPRNVNGNYLQSGLSSDSNNIVAGDLTSLHIINIDLQGKRSIEIDEISEIKVAVSSHININAVKVKINFPITLDIVSGKVEFTVNLQANKTQEFSIEIQSNFEGSWLIEVEARNSINDLLGSNSCIIYVGVSSEITQNAETNKLTRSNAASFKQSSNHMGPRTAGTATVYGYWSYQDGGAIQRPVKYATVEIWDEDTLGDDLLAITSTDASGYYSASIDNSDGLDGTADVYVKVFTSTESVQVYTEGGSDPYSSYTPTTENIPDGNWYAGSWYVADSQRPAFFIMDTVIDEYQWLYSRTGYQRSQVIARWPASDPDSAYSTGDELFIGASHQYARPTSLHEYAHCVHYAARGGSFPLGSGGWHTIFNESNTGFALTEGWAEFMQCAVDNDPSLVNDHELEFTVYADGTWGDYGQGYQQYGDFGDWDGNIVEGAVANVFWDIFDGINANDYPFYPYYGDYVNNEFGKLWNVLLNYDPDSIDEFYTYWVNLYGSSVDLWAIFYNARINKDLASPSNPSSYVSSHSVVAWSNDNTIFISWSGATDSLSGIYGFSYSWDTSPSTIPDTTIDTTLVNCTSSARADGTSIYFHIRARDRAGNWVSNAYHVGPFYIDATQPSNPTGCMQTQGSTTSGEWQDSVSDPAFTWSGASDALSGVVGYYYFWGTNSSGTSSNYVTSASYDPAALQEDGTYYLRVRTLDTAGNLASEWVTLYTFKYGEPQQQGLSLDFVIIIAICIAGGVGGVGVLVLFKSRKSHSKSVRHLEPFITSASKGLITEPLTSASTGVAPVAIESMQKGDVRPIPEAKTALSAPGAEAWVPKLEGTPTTVTAEANQVEPPIKASTGVAPVAIESVQKGDVRPIPEAKAASSSVDAEAWLPNLEGTPTTVTAEANQVEPIVLRCSYCQETIKDGRCSFCGAWICTGCGVPNHAVIDKCAKCGKSRWD